VFGKKGGSKGLPFFYVRVLPVWIQCTDGESLPGQPGNVYLATTAAFNRPGKVSLAQQQHHQKKKIIYFLGKFVN
jgi:hypothetical protein